jgi:hypothetical protein
VGRDNNRRGDVEQIQTRVKHARWRLRTAAYGGPEWQAAVAGLEELQAALDEVRRGVRRREA